MNFQEVTAMNITWTLHIEDFAKIKEADIQINSLMCFVGDNNSGKSYVMSLLWGLLTLGKDIFPKTPPDSKTYKKCEEWLKSVKNTNVQIGDDIIAYYIAWFNDVLHNNRKNLVKRIFNFNINIGKVEIKNYTRTTPLTLKWDTRERYSSKKDAIIFPTRDIFSREELFRMNQYICWNILMYGIAAPLFTPTVKGRRNGEPVYFPASRTGFMLTFPQLVESSLQTSFTMNEENTVNPLTLPYVDFLQLITKYEVKNTERNKFRDCIDFMENTMTKGKISVRKEMLPVIKYIPDGSSQELPLYTASSIIAETAPILLLLKSEIKFNALVIEEPEAHLHPELQQKMIQLIIRLVNLGIPVWITTHSDTIVQHINNMIKLVNNPDKINLMQSFGYQKEDIISPQNVSIYQFINQTNKTNIIPLNSGKYGFVVPTFNDALEKILEEVYAFQDGD